MPNRYGIDFDQVVRNAADQGIDLSEIALFYVGLSELEIAELKRHQVFVDQTSVRVIGRINKEGIALFPENVAEVITLSS